MRDFQIGVKSKRRGKEKERNDTNQASISVTSTMTSNRRNSTFRVETEGLEAREKETKGQTDKYNEDNLSVAVVSISIPTSGSLSDAKKVTHLLFSLSLTQF